MKHEAMPPFRSITFWLNAFVPRDVAGSTTTLLAGDFRGLTVLKGSCCYLTDQRAFSNNPRASSRMQSIVKLDFGGATPTIAQFHRCDETIVCDPTDGEIRCRRKASTAKMNFVMIASESKAIIRMDCKSENPCSPGGLFDEIVYNGTIEIDAAGRSIAIDIMIGLFPAFEAYTAIGDGLGSILFRQSPPPGILALRIPPGANRRIRSQRTEGDGECDTVID